MNTIRVHRITQARYGPTAFSGTGGLHAAGTWHTKGKTVTYAADSLSAAQLEIIVNYGREIFFGEWVKVVAEVPIDLIEDAPTLPGDWAAQRPLTQEIGDRWLSSGAKPVLRVPSKVTPGEVNFVLNPSHRDFEKVKILHPTPFVFDERIGHAQPPKPPSSRKAAGGGKKSIGRRKPAA